MYIAKDMASFCNQGIIGVHNTLKGIVKQIREKHKLPKRVVILEKFKGYEIVKGIATISQDSITWEN